MRGFTLIELLVVVVIIGILAGIAIPVFSHQKAKGYEAQVKAQVSAVAKATETALADAAGGALTKQPGSTTVLVGGTPGASVATTRDIEWDIAGEGHAYCIIGWTTRGGKYTPDAPLAYNSTKGGLTPEGCDGVPAVPAGFMQPTPSNPGPSAPGAPLPVHDGFVPSSTTKAYAFKPSGVRSGPEMDVTYAFELTSNSGGQYSGILTATPVLPAGYTGTSLRVGYANPELGAGVCEGGGSASAGGYVGATVSFTITCPSVHGLLIESTPTPHGCSSGSTDPFCGSRPTLSFVYFPPGHPLRPDTPAPVVRAEDVAGWEAGRNTLTFKASSPPWASGVITMANPTAEPVYRATGAQSWTSTWSIAGICTNSGWSPVTTTVTSHWRRSDTGASASSTMNGSGFAAGVPFYYLGYPCTNSSVTGTVAMTPPHGSLPAGVTWQFDSFEVGNPLSITEPARWFPVGHPNRP